MSIIYLEKASDDVVSYCSCGDGRVTFPGQADCPWCGCGWLFSCVTCRKAFTFAVGVELDHTWEQIAREDLRGAVEGLASDEGVAEWIAAMQEILAEVEVGRRYVILDGTVIPVDARDFELDGWYARHELRSLPQVNALVNSSVVERVLGNRDYWLANAHPPEE